MRVSGNALRNLVLFNVCNYIYANNNEIYPNPTPTENSENAPVVAPVPSMASISSCIDDKEELRFALANAPDGSVINICEGTIQMTQGDSPFTVTAEGLELVCAGEAKTCVLDGGRTLSSARIGRILTVKSNSFAAHGIVFQNALADSYVSPNINTML